MTHAVVEWLVENAQVQSQVGLNEEGDTYKVYPVVIPQTEKPPYVCARVTNVNPAECKGEASLEETDTVQVDCYGNSYQEAYTLYRVVRNVLDGNTFTAGDGTKLSAKIATARDASQSEADILNMASLAKRAIYGILSVYSVEVSLGDIT
jgi:hypothetical protein